MEKNLIGNEEICYKIIKGHPDINTSDLAKKMGVWARTARDVTRRLVKKGVIKKTGHETRKLWVCGQRRDMRISRYRAANESI